MLLNQRNISSPYRLTFLGRVRLRSFTLWAILPKKFTRQSNLRRIQDKGKDPYKQARAYSFEGSSDSTKTKNPSFYDQQPFRKAPFREKRDPARDYSDQQVFNKSSTSPIKFQGKLARYDCPFSSSTGENSFTESCSSSFRIGN